MLQAADFVKVTQLVQAWGLYRDQGLWPELATTFTAEGTISVTWFAGSHADFVEACSATHKPQSPRTKHLIGTPFIRIAGDRAVAETSIQILGRATVAGVAVDNTSYARFVDRIVRERDEWRIAERIAIYEKDRLDPVIPSAAFDRFMTETDFSSIPEPYRYLGFRLIEAGRTLRSDIVIDGSPEAERVLAKADAWLASSG